MTPAFISARLVIAALLVALSPLSYAGEKGRPSPADQFTQRLGSSSLEEQKQLLRDWAVNVAMPDLGNAACQVDNKYSGVRAMGQLVLKTDLSRVIDVPHLTYCNPDYWRGVMEMAPGNHLIALMPALMHLANGEWDHARRLFSILSMVSLGENPPAVYLAEANRHLELCYKGIDGETRRGISLHNQGKYDEAIGIYQKILASGVQCAWVRYELFFSNASKGGKDSLIRSTNSTGPGSWAEAAKKIYLMDPLYTAQFSAKRGKDMAAFLDRMALNGLWGKKDLSVNMKMATFADLALKLEDYPVAAHLYWYTLGLKDCGSSVDERITRFLYCLEKLGVSDLKKNFKGDFTKKFKQLDQDLTKHRST